MKNFQVTFRNGPTVIVQSNCIEGARVTAVAQTRRSFDDITIVAEMGGAF